MKRILISILVIIFLFGLASCNKGADTPTDFASASAGAEISKESPGVTNYSEENRSVSGRAGACTREVLSVPESTKYMLNATVAAEKQLNGSKIGLCAGTNALGQTLDFFYTVGGELSSYAAMYGNEKRSDLGQINIALSLPTTETSLTVIRDGDLFYLICGEELCQIREFKCDATAPGFSVTNATVQYSDIEFTDDPKKVDSAIASYMHKFEGYGIGDGYANFSGITFHDAGSFTIEDAFLTKSTEYSRIAFADSYSGDMEVTFTTSGLKALASADNSGDTMCRLRLLLYCENDVIDMICLGVANKQDRIETFSYYDIAQWYSHTDLTGNRSDYFDWSAENEFRIVLTNTGSSNTYSVYVNGALFAVRSSGASGPVQFGFEAENVCGTVRNFKVTGGDI